MADTDAPPADEELKQVPLQELFSRVASINMRLMQTGSQPLPMTALRIEALVDHVLPEGTPERDEFDRAYATKLIALGKEFLSMAARKQLLRK